ncbi:MAG TPA: hypothetical protein VIP46_23120, partial [Pyrinomonadaceae bacterium]
MPKPQLLRALPSVDALLRADGARALAERTGRARLTALARAVTGELRAELLAQASLSRAGGANGDDPVLKSEGDAARSPEGRVAKSGGRVSEPEGGVTRESLLAEAVRRLSVAVEREG